MAIFKNNLYKLPEGNKCTSGIVGGLKIIEEMEAFQTATVTFYTSKMKVCQPKWRLKQQTSNVIKTKSKDLIFDLLYHPSIVKLGTVY